MFVELRNGCNDEDGGVATNGCSELIVKSFGYCCESFTSIKIYIKLQISVLYSITNNIITYFQFINICILICFLPKREFIQAHPLLMSPI